MTASTVNDLTIATRLDRALDVLAAGGMPAGDSELRPLIGAAERVRAGLPAVGPSPFFEDRLARRLARRSPWRVVAGHPRLVIGGAVGSAAVSVAGVTAYAFWRAAHRNG